MSKSKSKAKNNFSAASYPSEQSDSCPEAPVTEPDDTPEEVETAVTSDETVPQEAPDPSPMDAPATTADADCTVSSEELARAVEEAEKRGYMRGRNEALGQAARRRSGIWEQPHREDALDESPEADADDDLVILRRIRPSIWD